MSLLESPGVLVPMFFCIPEVVMVDAPVRAAVGEKWLRSETRQLQPHSARYVMVNTQQLVTI